MSEIVKTDATSLKRLALLSIGALGVVFGDIGTSPLYALRECFSGRHAIAVIPANVLGTVSAVFWAVLIVVCLNYVVFLMRYDNRGEGGILSLMTLVDRLTNEKMSGSYRKVALGFLTFLGILGASLLFGDALITPAISVLSAVEGLKVATPLFEPFVLPFAIAILTLLFLVQKGGSSRLGTMFGPILTSWFLVLAFLGLRSVVQTPDILRAFNPLWALRLFISDFHTALALLGTVFLTLTGAEVLYADMGHFGKKPIRMAWFILVFPALVINYMGQGALLLREGALPQNLFYNMAPRAFIVPLVILASMATVIASQAVISGIFSLIRQAVALGFWPRLRVVHTSAHSEGQIYVPVFNLILFVGTISLILGFKESGRLAAAYGIAVSSIMIISAILMLWLSVLSFRKQWIVVIFTLLVFIPVNIVFFLSNTFKLMTGGWIVVAISAGAFVLISTWRSGRNRMRRQMEALTINVKMFMDDVEKTEPSRVPGTGVFLSGNDRVLPRSLLQNYMHNKVLHDTTVILTVKIENVPRVQESDRVRIEPHGQGIFRITISYGFFEEPNVPLVLEQVSFPGLVTTPADTTYFVDRVIHRIDHAGGGWNLRKRLFNYMSSNALDASIYFNLPAEKVIEIGLQTEV